ncbi:GNAT family N-acetyltransferase [Clostridium tagluense]|uniref:GNAT family N-acetyltransferase n=1 Tax=Clostridium tagluense TaxID=360422 RepID=UPI001C0B7B5E|nr:GNAT family N-acetyltransferase [Clostridium tagluense]MBU3130158.1 GNAT family N-acetyltransferase [Clostridium tagluense]
MMELSIKEYKNKYKSVISDFITDNSFVREDIVGCLDRWPQYGLIVKGEYGVLAVGVFSGESKTTSMTLYVKASKRKEGIGSMLIKSIEESMRNVGVEEVVCDFKANELEKSFLYKNGYKHWFYSNFMTYTGGKLAVANHEIINYEDKYYAECQKVFSESFHKMRLLVGLESTLSLPSEEERKEYKENAENIFVLRDSNKIVAVVRLEGNEIDAVAVSVEDQGKGYGKSLVSYAVDKLLDRGCTKVHLWVVEGNSAKFLYEKLDFITERTHEFVIKSIK